LPSRFSALQRAENSSNYDRETRDFAVEFKFQCSSASRKFLKFGSDVQGNERIYLVSVLFSEPKIPQTRLAVASGMDAACFSALQRAENSSKFVEYEEFEGETLFQCSSASRKFLKGVGFRPAAGDAQFQCSSASRKFLKVDEGVR